MINSLPYLASIMTILNYLKQPFPKGENKWKTIIFISLFVSLFLVIFQPFGIDRVNGKYILASGFGLVTFVVLVIDLIVVERFFPRWFDDRNWCIYKELLWLLCIILSIGVANALYAMLISGQSLKLAHIISFQVVTFAVAIFPLSIFILTKQNYLLRKHTASAKDTNESLHSASFAQQEDEYISISSYNGKVKVEFDINQLCFIESKGNDIELNITENNILVCKTLRNTLKNTLEQLNDSSELVQCHRAYIVNLNTITQVEGNSQGLVLKFKNTEMEVPVSRSFVGTIKRLLSETP